MFKLLLRARLVILDPEKTVVTGRPRLVSADHMRVRCIHQRYVLDNLVTK